ncbi:hypothetical protein SAMN05880582_10975 [Rhizobium sp. RU20A]|uniref:hypothetical protein n=1 Tax=Rhizobium sp. RU20A TaxID=1907412 RepID=UPI000956A267|nr:hypothetical protein [Rhizobium sp. RU20A]SIR28206.1 hypothetical protein SAMN05880582_10975 [Rhizobium sp. RU20A]
MRLPEKPELTPEEARRDHAEMLRFLALNAAGGALIGVAVALAIYWFDLGGFGTRVARADNPVLPILLLVVPLASIFGGAAAATSILTLPYGAKYKDKTDTRPGKPD